VKVVDLATVVKFVAVKLPDDQIDSLQLAFNPDGHLLAAGIHNKRFKLWDLTAKKDRNLDQPAKSSAR
jgi:WD40 repeat protein